MGLAQLRPTGQRRWRALVAAAGLVFAALALDAARLETPTVDEFAHVAAAYALVEHGALDLYRENPPLGKALLTLPGVWREVNVPPVRERPGGWGPWEYGRRFMAANGERYLGLVSASRAVVVVLALLTAGLVFLWTGSLFGERAAALSAALFLLSPTILAHGHLATLDVACAASVFASALCLRWACAGEAPARLALAGVVWGVALLVKFSALLLLPAYAGILCWRRGRRWGRALAELALLGAVALLVVNVGMGFRGSLTPLGDFTLVSGFGKGLGAALPDALPVPVPRDYLLGFDAQKLDVERAEFPAYLRGSWSRQGWWYYEVVALLVKTPVPLLLLLAACPFALLRRRLPALELAWLLVPMGVLGFMLTAFNALNVGARYLLPLHPFAFVLLGALFAGQGRAGRLARLAGLAALAWCAVAAVLVHPGHLGYFNLAVGGPSAGHRWLLDSNTDWGQDLYRLKPALERLDAEGPVSLLYFGHVDPGLYGIEYRLPSDTPERALVAASVSYLEGAAYPVHAPDGSRVPVRAGHLDWLLGREPVARLGSIWVFDTRSSPRD